MLDLQNKFKTQKLPFKSSNTAIWEPLLFPTTKVFVQLFEQCQIETLAIRILITWVI
jgi:hypothetical protein